MLLQYYHNVTTRYRDNTVFSSYVNETVTLPVSVAISINNNSTSAERTYLLYNYGTGYDSKTCHLTHYTGQGVFGYARLVAESSVVVMMIFQIIQEALEISSIGFNRWWQTLRSFPFKVLYRISLVLTLFLVPIRFACVWGETLLLLDNLISILVILMTSMHMLFYLRAIKFVGPFVVMIYTIFLRDMTRFFMIYAVFLFGFSQGFYLIFIACERMKQKAENAIAGSTNILSSPLEAMLRLFIMTIGEFTVFYRELNGCSDKEMATLGKVCLKFYNNTVMVDHFR